MGFILAPVGRITIEMRRESFRVIYDHDGSRDPNEYGYEDLRDMISALTEIVPDAAVMEEGASP